MLNNKGIQRKSESSRIWITSDGKHEKDQVDYRGFIFGWAYGEPNNSRGTESCAILRYSTEDLNDIPCDDLKPYTCVKTIDVGEKSEHNDENCMCTETGLVCEPTPPPTTTQCEVKGRRNDQATYDEAQIACENMGGHLFYARNKEEFDEFLEIDPARYWEWYGKFTIFFTFLSSTFKVYRESHGTRQYGSQVTANTSNNNTIVEAFI